jgi:hypothetical protein
MIYWCETLRQPNACCRHRADLVNVNARNSGERIVTEIEKLTNLREKLVIRRRSLVESFQRAAPERLTGDSVARIQSAIEAVDRAIADEMSNHDLRRRAVPAVSA